MKILIPIVEDEMRGAETPHGRSLYEIQRKTILEHVCEHLMSINNAEFIFVLNKQIAQKHHLDYVIKHIVPNAEIIYAEGLTAGSVCSCLLAIDHLNPAEPLIITGGDQVITEDLQNIVNTFINNQWDGGLICFDDVHPRWSFVKTDSNGFVIEAAEKMPISRNAATGFYYYQKAGDFVDAAITMMRKKASVNNKYYVCPAYNQMILKQLKIGTYTIDKQNYFNFSHTKGVDFYNEYLRKRGHYENR